MAIYTLRDYSINVFNTTARIELASGVSRSKSSYEALPTYAEIISLSGASSLTTLDLNSSPDEVGLFMGNTNMATCPTFPSDWSSFNYIDAGYVFYGCTALTTSPILPAVTSISMNNTFYNCTNLTGTINIPCQITYISDTFKGTTQAIALTGTRQIELRSLANTSTAGNVTYTYTGNHVFVKVSGTWKNVL